MIQQFFLCLSLFTRLPFMAVERAQTQAISATAWAFPLVGATIGTLAAGIYLNLLFLGISPMISAWLSLGFLVWITGGLHEDGLADTADGMAYGRTAEQRLSIMRDSRIGCYGAAALMITLTIRAQAIASFSAGFPTLLAFIITGSASRAFLPMLMRFVPPARKDGLAAHAGAPSNARVIAALFLGSLSLIAPASIPFTLGAIAGLALMHCLMARFARTQLGGITGDILGATQQCSELLLWVLLTRFWL